MSRVRMGKGQPLFALVAILGGWAGGRAATWTPPAIVPQAVALPTPALKEKEPEGHLAAVERPGPQSMPQSLPQEDAYGVMVPAGYAPSSSVSTGNPPAGYAPDHAGAMPGYAGAGREIAGHPPQDRLASANQTLPTQPAPAPVVEQGDYGIWNMVSKVLLRLGGGGSRAGFGLGGFGLVGDLPRFFAPEMKSPAAPAAPGAVPAATPAAPARPRRWSADAWALLRRETNYVPRALPAHYGGSQAGAVLRYRLSSDDGHRPAFYMRVTSTLGQIRDSSAAAGLSARPIAGLPVVGAVEARLTQQSGMTVIQPAAIAVTELAPFKLPGQMLGDLYLQGGYVGGKFATPFIDGQFRFDHAFWSKDRFETRLGGGIWGGAQKGASRLDIGPSATLKLPIGRSAFGRVALDWRFRMAGDAQPGSGPALTLSAGF